MNFCNGMFRRKGDKDTKWIIPHWISTGSLEYLSNNLHCKSYSSFLLCDRRHTEMKVSIGSSWIRNCQFSSKLRTTTECPCQAGCPAVQQCPMPLKNKSTQKKWASWKTYTRQWTRKQTRWPWRMDHQIPHAPTSTCRQTTAVHQYEFSILTEFR